MGTHHVGGGGGMALEALSLKLAPSQNRLTSEQGKTGEKITTDTT
jgi:hypothetical protein